MTRHILITGAHGFLGQYVLEELYPSTQDVFFCLSRTNPFGSHEHKNFHWIPCDLTEGIPLSPLPERIDGILHLAQSNHYRSFPKRANDIFDVNVGSTQRLLDLAYKRHTSHFMFTSTGSIYEKTGTWGEENVVSPKGYYPLTKYLCEEMIKAYQDHFSICILRLFHLFGPRQQQDRLIPSLIMRIENEEVIELRGGINGPLVCPTFIQDTARLLKECISHQWNGIYNVGSKEVISLRALCNLIGDILKKNVSFHVSSLPYPSVLPHLEKISKIIDLSSFTPLEEGLRAMISRGHHDQKVS